MSSISCLYYVSSRSVFVVVVVVAIAMVVVVQIFSFILRYIMLISSVK